MRTFYKLSWLSILSLSAVSSYGDTYDFSYTFAGNYYDYGIGGASGSFQGTPNGNFVDNVTDVSLFFNGSPVTGPFYTATYDPSVGWVNGASVSYDVTLNNFLFINSDYANNGEQFAADDGFFGSLPASIEGRPYTFAVGNHNPDGNALVETADYPSVPANWTLTDVSVPDGGLTAAMLGAALVGLGAIRRKL